MAYFTVFLFFPNKFLSILTFWNCPEKKIYFGFQNSTKNLNKLRQFTKLDPFSTFQLLNCPNFVTTLCRVSRIKITLSNILSNSLPFAVRNSLTNPIYQKMLGSGNLEKKKVTIFNMDINPGDSWQYIVYIIEKST